MAFGNQSDVHPAWGVGRGFASVDPERQREVIGYVRPGGIETRAPTRPAPDRGVRSGRIGWIRVQPEQDGGNFEGSSSRRSR